MKPIFKT